MKRGINCCWPNKQVPISFEGLCLFFFITGCFLVPWTKSFFPHIYPPKFALWSGPINHRQQERGGILQFPGPVGISGEASAQPRSPKHRKTCLEVLIFLPNSCFSEPRARRKCNPTLQTNVPGDNIPLGDIARTSALSSLPCLIIPPPPNPPAPCIRQHQATGCRQTWFWKLETWCKRNPVATITTEWGYYGNYEQTGARSGGLWWPAAPLKCSLSNQTRANDPSWAALPARSWETKLCQSPRL